jgi:YesN/AraC family two-component response regulator
MEPTLPLITIIAVNQQRAVCEFWKQLFDSTPGLSCPKYATNGVAALKLVNEIKPKVLLVDTYLPDISAQELVEIAQTESPETVIVMYSEDAKGKKIALDAGADQYFSIPVDQITLIHTINRAYHDKQS